MKDLHEYGGLVLATRLKRVSDALFAAVDSVYRDHRVSLPARCFPILFLVRDNGPMGVMELAATLGQTHSAVSQMSRTLADYGVLTERADPGDERRRLLALSAKGEALLKRLAPVWQAIVGALDDITAANRIDLAGALTSFEAALRERDFAGRIAERQRLQDSEAVEIIPFEPRYREDFKRLNVEWLEKYFYVEAIDHQVLSHPEDEILKPGGFVLLARYKGDIVGTSALIRAGRSRFELSKMAVTERYQGLRIGHRLLVAAIEQFKKTGARQLFLESNRKLQRALALYEANGFRHAPRPKGLSHYQRSDVYMVYKPKARSRVSI